MSKPTREIINIHIGQFSNFIGTHWLNLQEASFVYDDSTSTDIHHDFMFREGKLINNEISYVPRLLVIDAKGSLRTLKTNGLLYDDSKLSADSAHAIWDGDVSIHAQQKEHKNEFLKALEEEDEFRESSSGAPYKDNHVSNSESRFLDLRNEVQVWSDFLRPHLHPNTIFILQNVCHQDLYPDKGKKSAKSKIKPGGHEVERIWTHQDGLAVMSEASTEEETEDRIRLLSEACDSIQGFHIIADGHNGMGGVSSVVAEHLADEYRSKDVFSFVTTPAYGRTGRSLSIDIMNTNLIQTYSTMAEYSSLLIPLHLKCPFGLASSQSQSWPYLSFQDDCPYESSSVLAAFLETITTPWRRKSTCLTMDYVASILSPLQRKIVDASFSFPLGIDPVTPFGDWLTPCSSEKLQLRSVGGSEWTAGVSELCALRGISHQRAFLNNVKYPNCWEVLEAVLKEEAASGTLRSVSGAQDPLQTTVPFPQIFSPVVNCQGLVETSSRSVVNEVPAFGKLTQMDGIGLHLRKLFRWGSKLKVERLQPHCHGALDKETWSDALQNLLNIAECYGSTSDSDSDD